MVETVEVISSDALQHHEAPSRTAFYVFAALIVGTVLLVTLSFFSFYSRYFRHRQILAIQASATADLHMVADAEKKFRSSHGFYTTDFDALGLSPKAVLYKFGFTKPGLHESRFTARDIESLKAKRPELAVRYSPVTRLETIDFNQTALLQCPDCTATADTFKVLGVAHLGESNKLDVWTLDSSGHIVHLQDGLSD